MNVRRVRWLRWTVLISIVLAAAAFVAVRVLTPRHASPEQLAAEMKTQAALTGPAKLYTATCAQCHDTGIGPSLRGRGLPAAAIQLIARRGNGPMPSFGPGAIADAPLVELAAYISQLPATAKP